MASIKLRFRPSSVSGKEGMLYYQIIHGRSSRWIRTGYHLKPENWNVAKSRIRITGDIKQRNNLQVLSAQLDWEMRQRQKFIAEWCISHSELSLAEMCVAFDSLPKCRSVFTFLQEQIDHKALSQRVGTAQTYISAVNRFKEFRCGKDLSFESMTSKLMEQYEGWLISRDLHRNTIAFYLRTLRAIYRKAVDEKLSAHADIFRHVHTTYVQTVKRAITEKELRLISRINLKDEPTLAFARDMFMFSFYMRGMSFVDMAYLKKSDLRYGMVTYSRRKTNQQLSVAWEREMDKIVRRYADQTKGSSYMLPILKGEGENTIQQVRTMECFVNRQLKRIGNLIGLKMPLTTYVARHTWASLAQSLNVPVSVISEGMGHSSIKTTQVYLSTIETSTLSNTNRMIIRRINAR